MSKRIIIAQAKLRLRVKIFCPQQCLAYIALCAIAFTSLFRLSQHPLFSEITIVDGLVYEYGNSQNYFFMFAPIMIICISDVLRLDELEVYIFSRGTRAGFVLSEILTVISYSFLLLFVSIIISLFLFVVALPSKSTINTINMVDYLLGVNHVNNTIKTLPTTVFAIIIVAFTLFAFITSGLSVLHLRYILRQHNYSVILVLTVNFILLLLFRSDMSKCIHRILPTGHLFLTESDTFSSYLVSVIYWVFFDVALAASTYFVAMKRDFISHAVGK